MHAFGQGYVEAVSAPSAYLQRRRPSDGPDDFSRRACDAVVRHLHCEHQRDTECDTDTGEQLLGRARS